jgi:hypothetical protein
LKKEILLISLFFIHQLVSVQKKEHLFTGKIKDSLKFVKNVNIKNLRTINGTNSNIIGKFKINAAIGDSLKITSIQYKTRYWIITKYDVISKQIEITLSAKRYKLDEIVLKKHDLKGSLFFDMKRKKKTKNEVSAVSLGLPNAGNKKLSQIDRKLYTATTSSGGVSLDLIINLLSGRIKRLKKEQKIVDENNDVEFIFQKLKHFLTSDFKIKKEHQYRFLYYCRSDSLFNKKSLKDELVLIKFIHKKSIDVRKNLYKISEIKE